MSTKIAVTPDRIMQLGLAFWGSKPLLSPVNGPESVSAQAATRAKRRQVRQKLLDRAY
jgi:hypothetical protein